jgi:hypothetical protein
LLTGDAIDTLAAAAIYAVFNAWSFRRRDGLLSVTGTPWVLSVSLKEGWQ